MLAGRTRETQLPRWPAHPREASGRARPWVRSDREREADRGVVRQPGRRRPFDRPGPVDAHVADAGDGRSTEQVVELEGRVTGRSAGDDLAAVLAQGHGDQLGGLDGAACQMAGGVRAAEVLRTPRVPVTAGASSYPRASLRHRREGRRTVAADGVEHNVGVEQLAGVALIRSPAS